MKIKVQKKNPAGEVTYQYDGTLLTRDEHSIVLEAFFDRADLAFMGVVFKTGDRFIETYYTDRWYNIFAVHDRDDRELKGWYCNIGMPAVLDDGVIFYVDLALDLWVSVDGSQTVLDEDEFEALALSEESRAAALHGLQELKDMFLNQKPPV